MICKNGFERQRRLAEIYRAFRRDMLRSKLNSPEAWRLFVRNRLAGLFGLAKV